MAESMKRCSKCLRDLSLDNFHLSRTKQYGRTNLCKSCVAQYSRDRRRKKGDVLRRAERNYARANRDRRIAYGRKYNAEHREELRQKSRDYHRGNTQQWQKYAKADARQDPVRLAAYTVLRKARRHGVINEMPCIRCGSMLNLHAHHEDYSKPLEVEWLCASCHRRRHASG